MMSDVQVARLSAQNPHVRHFLSIVSVGSVFVSGSPAWKSMQSFSHDSRSRPFVAARS